MTIFILTFLLIIVILCAAVAQNMVNGEDDDGGGWWMVLLLVCFLAAGILYALGALNPREVPGGMDSGIDIEPKEIAGLGAFMLFFFLVRLWADK